MKWLALFPNCIEQLNHSSSLDFHSFLLHFQCLHLRSNCANNMNPICKYVTLHQFGWWCPHCIVLTFALWRTLLCFLPFEGTLCPMKVTTVSTHSTKSRAMCWPATDQLPLLHSPVTITIARRSVYPRGWIWGRIYPRCSGPVWENTSCRRNKNHCGLDITQAIAWLKYYCCLYFHCEQGEGKHIAVCSSFYSDVNTGMSPSQMRIFPWSSMWRDWDSKVQWWNCGSAFTRFNLQMPQSIWMCCPIYKMNVHMCNCACLYMYTTIWPQRKKSVVEGIPTL